MLIRRILLLITSIFLYTTLSAAAQTDDWIIPYTSIGRGQIESVAWYPDNERIFVSTANDVWIYGLDLEVVAHLPNVGFGRLSPNGWYIAGMGDADAITVWNADTFEVVAVLSENNPLFEIYDVEWSPDSHYLASVGRCQIDCAKIWDAEKFEESYSGLFSAKTIQWGPGGDYAVFHDTGTETLYVVDPTERMFNTYHPESEGYGSVIWQDETHFDYYAYTGGPSYIATRINVVTGETTTPNVIHDQAMHFPPSAAGFVDVFMMSGHLYIQHLGETIDQMNFQTSGASWSHEGTRLAFGSGSYMEAAEAEIHIYNAPTRQVVLTFRGLIQNIRFVEWSLNDRYLIVTDARDTLALYDIETRSILGQSNAHQEIGSTAAWRPGHNEIAVADSQGGWALWNVETQDQIATSEGRRLSYPVRSIEWQSQGQLLYTTSADAILLTAVPEGLVYDVSNPNVDPLPTLTEYAGTEENRLRYFHWHPTNETVVVYLPEPQQEHVSIWSIAEDSLLEDFPINPDSIMFTPGKFTSISASGRYLIVICDYYGGCPRIIQNLDNGETHQGYRLTDTQIYAWAEDDRLIALSWWVHAHSSHYGRYDADITIMPDMNQPNVIETYTIREFTDKVNNGFLSPHGRYFAVMDEESNGLAGTTETGNVLFMLSNVANVVWSPDETRLIVQRTDGAIWLMESDGTILAELDRPRSFNGAGGEFVWSPEGDQLALVHAGYVLVWDITS